MVAERVQAGARHRGVFVAVAVVVLAVDILTKQAAVTYWADRPVSILGTWFRLTESRNPGAAFGLATNATPVLALIATVAALALVVMTGRAKGRATFAIMGLAMGGITGNLVDRLFRAPGPLHGHVVDWIDVGSWPNFNVADSALVTSGVLFVLLTVLDRTPEPEADKRR